MKPKRWTFAAVAAAALAALPLEAETYYWKPGAEVGLWTELSNWSTESATGADASATPGSGDGLALNHDYAFDLGGGSYTLKLWGTAEKQNTSAERSLYVQNGSLAFSNLDACPISITVGNGGAFSVPGRFGGGNNGSKTSGGPVLADVITVKNGGSASFYDLNPARMKFVVEEGGTLAIPNNKYFGAYNNVGSMTDITVNGIWNSGTLNLTPSSNGNASEFTLQGTGGGWHFTLAQQGGVLNLPCNINGASSNSGRPVYLHVEMSGGTINVTDDAKIYNCASATLSGSTVWNVSGGKTANLATLTIADGTTVTKSGTGTLVLPSVPATFAVADGTASLSATIPSSAALKTLDVGDGGTLTIDVANASVDTLSGLSGALTLTKPGLEIAAVADGAALTGSVVVGDLTPFSTGATLATVADGNATLLAKLLAAANDAIAAASSTLQASQDGNSIVIAPAGSVNVFNSSTVADLSDPDGWSEGALPPANELAIVSGSGVTGTVTAAAIAAGWSGISVMNGATLRLAVDPGELAISLDGDSSISVGAGLTVSTSFAGRYGAVTLESGATLAVADGETFSLPSSLKFLATEDALPTLLVERGGTLEAAGGAKFRNVALRIEGGTLRFPDDSAVTFGYADAGETAYFAMSADGATIGLASGNMSGYRFASPASGGEVVVKGDIVLKNTTLTGWPKGFILGANNPVSDEFSVVLDNMNLTWYKGPLTLAGASTLVVSNGTLVTTSGYNDGSKNGDDTAFSIVDAGQLVVGEGGTLFYPVSNQGNTSMEVGTAAADRPAVVLDGGVFEPYLFNPNAAASARTALVASDSVYQIYEDTYWETWRRNVPFGKMAGVAIEEGATLTLRNRLYAAWPGNDNTGVWFADSPVSGAGNIALVNAYDGKPFAVTFRNGGNTATGTISADAASEIRFANGSNWAGTVVSDGNVSLVNLSSSSSPASAAFGTLALASGEFPLRVWKSVDEETGEVSWTADQIAVGAFANGGGVIAPALVGAEEGDEIPRFAKIAVGTVSKSSPLPALARPWVALVAPLDDDTNTLILQNGRGMAVILR